MKNIALFAEGSFKDSANLGFASTSSAREIEYSDLTAAKNS